jgi:hypothetical protein
MVRKGFYFSMDAVMGLMLMSTAAGLMITSANIGGVTAQEVEFNTYSSQAIDLTYLMKREDFSSLNQSYRKELVDNTVLEEDDRNIGRAIAKLHRDDSSRTSELAGNYLDTFRHDAGLFIESDEVVGIDAETQSSKTFHVSTSEGLEEFTVVVGE